MIDSLSVIRGLGLVIGFAMMAANFAYHRGTRWSRSVFGLVSLVAAALIVVSIAPQSVDVLRDSLSLNGVAAGRLVALAILASFASILLALYAKSRADFLQRSLDRIVGAETAERALISQDMPNRAKPILVLIAALNEAENLRLLLPKMPAEIDGRAISVLVIDDGSSDGTSEVAASHGCFVARNSINRGQGAAFRVGYTIARRCGTEIVVTMDADNQHRPEDLFSEKGFLTEEIQKLNNAALAAFEIGFLFNKFILGEACLERLGFTAEQYNDWSFDLLDALGFTDEQIEAANDYVCGTMTVEGAPSLKPEHLAVFDCANKCGKKGERYIHAHGHIRMMAACQPFLSGAISKTINLPHEATVEEIADSYMLSWQLSLKACALYRDGSKLSQPLSNKSDKKKKAESQEAGKPEETASIIEEVKPETKLIDLSALSAEELLEEVQKRMQASSDTALKRQLSKIVERKTLPAKRYGFTQKAKINGQVLFMRTGEYNDGTLGEIFVDLAKEGSTLRSLMNCFAIAVSVGLQYGVPLEEFVEKFVFTKFEPAGMVDHPNIKTTTSLVDFVFRCLAYEYLGRTDLVHVIDKPEITNLGSEDEAEYMGKPSLSNLRVKNVVTNSATHQQKLQKSTAHMHTEPGLGAANAAAKSMQSDAPSCNVCGHITVRSGTCYKCLNCGNSMGCS